MKFNNSEFFSKNILAYHHIIISHITREVPELSPKFPNETCHLSQSIEHPRLLVRNCCHICWGALGAEIQRSKFWTSYQIQWNNIANSQHFFAVGWATGDRLSCGFETRCGPDFMFSFRFFKNYYIANKSVLGQKIIYLESALNAESNDILFVKSKNFSESWWLMVGPRFR